VRENDTRMSDQSVSSIADSIWRFQSITFEWGFSRCRSDFEGCLGVAATPRHAVSSCYLGAAHKLSMSYCVARRSYCVARLSSWGPRHVRFTPNNGHWAARPSQHLAVARALKAANAKARSRLTRH